MLLRNWWIGSIVTGWSAETGVALRTKTGERSMLFSGASSGSWRTNTEFQN